MVHVLFIHTVEDDNCLIHSYWFCISDKVLSLASYLSILEIIFVNPSITFFLSCSYSSSYLSSMTNYPALLNERLNPFAISSFSKTIDWSSLKFGYSMSFAWILSWSISYAFTICSESSTWSLSSIYSILSPSWGI